MILCRRMEKELIQTTIVIHNVYCQQKKKKVLELQTSESHNSLVWMDGDLTMIGHLDLFSKTQQCYNRLKLACAKQF